MNGSASYTYDSVGNRTQKVSTIPGYPGGLTNYNANDELATDSYDANGNTTASNGLGYVYDFENHLIQQGGVSIVYDADGNRRSKTVAGVTKTYVVADENPTGYAQVLEEDDSTGAVRQYTYALDLLSRWDTVTGNSIYSTLRSSLRRPAAPVLLSTQTISGYPVLVRSIQVESHGQLSCRCHFYVQVTDNFEGEITPPVP